MAKSNKTQGRQIKPSRGGQHNHPMGTAGPSYGPSHTHQINENNGRHSGANQHTHTTLPSNEGANPGHTHTATGGQHSNQGSSHLHEFGTGGSGQFSHTHDAGSPNIFMSGQHQHAGGEVRGGNGSSQTRNGGTRNGGFRVGPGPGQQDPHSYHGWQESGDGFPGTGDFYTGPTWEEQVTNKVHFYNFGYPTHTMENPSPDSFMYTNNTQLPIDMSGFGLLPGNGPNRVLISAPHAQNQYRPTRWNKICAQSGGNYPQVMNTHGTGCNNNSDCPNSHPVCTSNSPNGGGYYCSHYGYQAECAKEVDFCTGPLARTAAEYSGAHLIYAKFIQEDPNYYDNIGIDMVTRDAMWNLQSDNEFNSMGIQTEAYWTDWVQNSHTGGEHPYKAALRAYVANHPEIKFVLDVHGASNDNGWDIDLGSMHYDSLPIELLYYYYNPQLPLTTDIREILFSNKIGDVSTGNFEIGPISHNDFAADGQYTVTKFAKEQLGLDSLQLEWARIFRCVDNNHTFNDNQNQQTFRAVNAMVGIVQHLNDYYNMIDPL